MGIVVEQLVLPINEIQSADGLLIAQHKADEAFRQAGRPAVVINDAFWTIPALNGFPGGYMKEMQAWFTPADWLRLMSGLADRRICVTESIIYRDAQHTKQFSKEYWLRITTGVPRGKGGESIEQVVEDDKGLTISEYEDQGGQIIPLDDYIWGDLAHWLAHQ